MSAADLDLEIDDAPTTINPYTVLSVAHDATAAQIKTAYRKAALKHHPDKVGPDEKESAHTKFQEVAFAYAILSDEKRRRRYDTTGNTSDSLDIDGDDFNWYNFFREQFENVVTEETITNFSNTYKGSEEEREHVLRAYEKHRGSMSKLYQEVMLSDMLEDEERFREIIDQGIADGEVERYTKYADETEKARNARMTQQKKRREAEAKDAEKAQEEIETDPKSKTNRGKGKTAESGMSGLAAMIQQRQKGRAEGFFDQLEEKYGGEGGKGKKAGSKRGLPVEEPSEEAFARNRKAGKGDAGTGKNKRPKKI
ncbi:hypothetical protein B0A50_07699 [Salinomyces thailandicus]|uniref:J domain-containing protein n=1 Tax=Salinomyces thailandicus TaxID=706561 RepID=A0A4U0TM75_9PEZI|nr:hypothetical protein B0A50_07699 [Salinomyces thailandica]